jgi:predicted nucleic acid-binding protein
MPEIVLDTCVLSNFALAGAMGLIEKLYGGQAVVPDFVAVEIMRGIQSGNAGLEAVPEAIKAGWLKEAFLRSREEKELFEVLSRSMGLGEAAGLALAAKRGWRFASDDREARAEAARLGICLTGTAGILIKAVRSGVCDLGAADASLAKMIEAGFFSPDRSVREVLGPQR